MRRRASCARTPSSWATTGWKPTASSDSLKAMFTGIVTDVGRVASLARQTATTDTRIAIETRFATEAVALGASIACAGCCLTVVDKGGRTFAVEASAETLDRTTLGGWQVGTPVNLERSLK